MSQSKRVALVIGNSNYGNMGVSGVEDAKAMTECLEELGFDVVGTVLDGTLEATKKALAHFETKISEASVVLFFYAGHGFQLQGKNFLLPTDGDITPQFSISVHDDVLQALGAAPQEALKFVFLDACRDERRVSVKGLASPEPAPLGVLQAFAASPGQLAASGTADELSLYTIALLRYLREPGLELVKFFDKVRADVVRDSPRGRQQPIVEGAIPPGFFFRGPVFVNAKIAGWPHSSITMILNGEVVSEPDKPVQLKAEDNDLVLMVSNGKTYHNEQIWGRTSGWSYKLDLELPKDGNGDSEIVPFDGSEDVPFKDGPHHGQTFIVAQAKVFVHPRTAKVTVASKDTDIAKRKLPFWAKDQEILFHVKLAELGLSPDDIFGDAINFKLAPLFKPILADFLKTGKILGTPIVNPDDTFVVVRGNKALQNVATHCMTQEIADRLRDVRASFASWFNDRNPRPFDIFVHGLNTAIQANASNPDFGLTAIPLEDLRAWVSLDDLSPDVPPTGETEALAVAAVPALVVADAGTAISEESLRAMAQDALLLPRPDEVLLDTRSVEQTVQGVPIKAEVYTFLSIGILDDKVKLHARAIADLSDFQNKIGALVDTIPLPTDNCSHFGLDNVVARIWGKQITVSGNVATLKLNGDVEVWTCLKNPIPCTRTVFDEVNVFGGKIRIPRIETFDCNPPIKNRNLSQPFDATLPFSVAVVDSDTFAIKLGDPDVNLGGALGGVTEGILKIAGVDVNAKVKEALDQAVNPEVLKQNLPEFLLKYNPTLTRAELLSNSGALALTLEADALLDAQALGELIQEFANSQ